MLGISCVVLVNGLIFSLRILCYHYPIVIVITSIVIIDDIGCY